VGVIGCGSRGTGAAIDCLNAAPNMQIVALGDLFQDRLDSCRARLTELGDAVSISGDRCFVGFDAYHGVLSCDLEMVILAAPPGFRPPHLAASIEAGKHVFMEKPVAVDPVGIRSVIASSELAATQGLGIVAGTQRRHQPGYVETMKRIGDGAIGDLVGGQCYWNQGGLWVKPQKPEWSDMEWQCRNWLYFTWLSGDHIVEQHVHNIDVINWAMNGPPVKALGMGGRQVRTAPKYGNIYDHFAVEYEYANGARVLSMCRQIDGTSHRVSERLVGTEGSADPGGMIQGKHAFTYEPVGEAVNPYVQEHTDLITSIREGRPLNEGKCIAESTMTAIMGRMSAYTGREISWKWAMNASKLDLTPPRYEMGDLPVGPVPKPGETELI
jgi:predicted dehydrogenase